MEYNFHQRDRNCEGKYPNSTWAKTGFDVGPIKINQCPKTFITGEARQKIENVDTERLYFEKPRPYEVENYKIELWKIIDYEREKISSANENARKLKQHGRV